MKVKFLRNYGDYKIGEEREITVDDDEKRYMVSTKTVLVLEDDVPSQAEGNQAEEEVEEIPQIEVPEEEEKVAKNGRKGNSK